MSVVGIVTIFSCDGEGCETWKAVNIEYEIDIFCDEWFVGTDAHFCKLCKVQLANQATIAAQEFDMDTMSKRITERVLMAKEVANVH